MFGLLLILFIVLPIAEIYVIIQVGAAIGPWWTILILVADSIAGALLWRWQGRAVWKRFQDALTEGRMPRREIIDGALVILGGALLMTPGFITDIFGIIVLIPPTRAVVRGTIIRSFAPATMARFVFVRVRDSATSGPARRVDQPPPPQLPPG